MEEPIKGLNIIPRHCGCAGNGWMVTSNLTSISAHKCKLHYRGQPMPSLFDESLSDPKPLDFDYAACLLRLEREAYVRIRGDFIDIIMGYNTMTKEEAQTVFTSRVKALVQGIKNPTPADWLIAATNVVEALSEFR